MSDKSLVIGRKLAPKLVYGVGDARYHLWQNISDGYHLGDPTLLEHYLNGNIGLCLEVRCRLPEGDAPEFCAVFSDLNAAWGAHGDDLNAWSTGVDLNSVTQSDGLGENDKEPVFVYVVEILNGSEDRVLRRSRSVARLYQRDDFLSVTGNVLYSSILTGFSKFALLGVNGELVPFLNRIAIPEYERGKEVVQARTQMMYDLSRQHCKSVWNINKQTSAENVISCLVVQFSGDRVRLGVRTEECVDFSVEILDALVGPLNFRSTPTQQASHLP